MDTETIEERSLTDLQEILSRMGGWPVVEGEGWKGEESFLWWELSVRAAREGFNPNWIVGIGKAGDIGGETLQQQSQVWHPTPRTLRGG